MVESGPIAAVHGVVRWRLIDLAQWIFEEFRITIAKPTLSRELRAMGYRKLSARHEEFGISVSDDTIYRALKDLGFSHVSARPKPYKQDPAAMAAFKKTLPTAWRKSAPSSRRAHP
jgi:transposase-like protein